MESAALAKRTCVCPDLCRDSLEQGDRHANWAGLLHRSERWPVRGPGQVP